MPWTAVNSEGYVAPAALAVDTVVLTVREGAVVARGPAVPLGSSGGWLAALVGRGAPH